MTDLAILAEAARRERDHRASSYPARLAAELPDTPAYAARLEAMTVDYQCWCAIAEWLETGRFGGFYGGPDQNERDARWIGWAQLEEAAGERAAEDRPKAERDEQRVTCLFGIHRRLQLRRQLVDSINADLRAVRASTQRAAA